MLATAMTAFLTPPRGARALTLLLALWLSLPSAHATVYFVDAEVGDDAWSGLATSAPTAPAVDGPWRTLARVGTANLQPGDEVRLRCGQSWNETLRVNQSGTADSPILIGTYPLPCATRPTIDGRVTIPADNWVLDHDKVYRATLPINLIRNGALTRTVAPWTQPTKLRGTMAIRRSCNKPMVGCLHFSSPSKGKGLVASASFKLRRGQRYRARFSVFAPKSVTVTARIRRSGPTDFAHLAAPLRIAGTGKWQGRSFEFLSRSSADDTRFLFEVAAAAPGVAFVQLRDVAINPITPDPIWLVMKERPLQEAHHPNFGHDPERPLSPYFVAAADSVSGAEPGQGSSFLTTGTDFSLPTGTSIEPGVGVRIRSQSWNVDDSSVASVMGSRIELSAPTAYPIKRGWGYFFVGAPWMVDSPDEWFYDSRQRAFIVQMPDNRPPLDRLSMSTVGIGIAAEGLRHLIIEDIAVRGVGTGISLATSSDVVVRNAIIEDTRRHGVFFPLGQRITVEKATVRRTGRDAISACAAGAVDCGRSNVARDNTVIDSGSFRSNGTLVSLPAPSYSAIGVGHDSIATGNRIAGSSAYGIFLRGTSTVSRNSISDACLHIDDCAGIYSSMLSNGSTIEGNLVRSVHGTTDGTPHRQTLSSALYMDELATNLLVQDNAFIDGDIGIHMHNCFSNSVSSNLVYGNRDRQIWMQEQSRILRDNGDIHQNLLSGNTFVQSKSAIALVLESELGDTQDFATFQGNIYSLLDGSTVIQDRPVTGSFFYDFSDWRSAPSFGAVRATDLSGRPVALTGFTTYRVTGTNLVPNGALVNGLAGWTRFNDVSPLASMTLEDCNGPCVSVTGGLNLTLLSSPNFSVAQGQWYRVSFDARSDVDGEMITVRPRRGGGGTAGYEDLADAPRRFAGSTEMRRYAFVFQARITVTANDPSTGELGARIDFERIAPGRVLQIANLEMVPLGSEEPKTKISLVFNEDVEKIVETVCPDRPSDEADCANYVNFSDGTPVTFPISLQPLEARVLYTRDPSLVDGDSDGIRDYDDACPHTLTGLAVNASGCSVSQQASR